MILIIKENIRREIYRGKLSIHTAGFVSEHNLRLFCIKYKINPAVFIIKFKLKPFKSHFNSQ